MDIACCLTLRLHRERQKIYFTSMANEGKIKDDDDNNKDYHSREKNYKFRFLLPFDV